MLSIRKLTGGYAATDEIVKSVDVDVAPGEILTVIGPNGAGKSTALKLIAGILNAKSGDILFFGENLVGQSPQARASRGLVFVPQERNVFAALSVAENLEMGAYLEPTAARARAASLYDRFPILAERKRMPASSLSGGQRQTLAMAIGMMATPRVMLLDEPTAALSPQAMAEIFAVARAIADDGIAVLMVEQNALAALAISERALVLVDGRKIMEGNAREMCADPEVRRAFLGGRA